MKPAEKRKVISWANEAFKISNKRSCRLFKLARSSAYYKADKTHDEYLKQRIREIAGNRPRFGYKRILVMLKREGVKIGKCKMFRLYKELGLGLKKRTKKRKYLAKHRIKPEPATQPNQRWSIDFISDRLVSGRQFRSLVVIDQFSRKCLAVVPRFSYPSTEVIKVLTKAAWDAGAFPESITLDNGPEFISSVFDEWAHKNKVELDFIPPGKPNQNGFVESLNGKFRDECLSVSIFKTMDEAVQEVSEWVKDYNKVRPHSSLNDKTPSEIWKRFQEDLDDTLRKVS